MGGITNTAIFTGRRFSSVRRKEISTRGGKSPFFVPKREKAIGPRRGAFPTGGEHRLQSSGKEEEKIPDDWKRERENVDLVEGACKKRFRNRGGGWCALRSPFLFVEAGKEGVTSVKKKKIPNVGGGRLD